MKSKVFILLLLVTFILISCKPSVVNTQEPETPPTQQPPTSTNVPVNPTVTVSPVVDTSTPVVEFDIVEAQVLSDEDIADKEFMHPGVNVKVTISNLDTGFLPEEQLIPNNFCDTCVGWDNAGIDENGNEVVILHFYSFDLKEGDNTIRINANGIQKQTSINWIPPTEPASTASSVYSQGNFAIIQAEAITADSLEYQGILRPGVNIKLLLSNLDPGLLPEDQLKPKSFCITCMGWDNVGEEAGYNVVILHYSSSSLKAGENTLKVSAYGISVEFTVQYDPSIHLFK